VGLFSGNGEAANNKADKAIKAYLGEDTFFSGKLSFEGAVRIDGRFEGEVDTPGTLIIGEKGEFTGEIFAGTVVCNGKVNGSIEASQRIEINATSRILGNIRTPALAVEVGGLFEGNCDMSPAGKKIIPLNKDKEVGYSG
jgi:cytoskeletal protein CcmA (bactofilin family)